MGLVGDGLGAARWGALSRAMGFLLRGKRVIKSGGGWLVARGQKPIGEMGDVALPCSRVAWRPRYIVVGSSCLERGAQRVTGAVVILTLRY